MITMDAERPTEFIHDDISTQSQLQYNQHWLTVDPELVDDHSINDNSLHSTPSTSTVNSTAHSINVESLNTYANNNNDTIALYIPSYDRLFDVSSLGITICVLCGYLLAASTIASVQWNETSNTSNTSTTQQCDGTSNYILRVSILGEIGIAAYLVLYTITDIIVRLFHSFSAQSNVIFIYNILYIINSLISTAGSFALMILTILHVSSDCRSIQTILFNFCFLSALFIGCVSFAVFVYSTLTLNQQYQNRIQELHNELQRTATSRYVQSLPSIPYNNQQFDNESSECIICYCEYELHQPIIILQCRHHYHQQCIQQWLKRKLQPSCPTCRQPVYVDQQYTIDLNQSILNNNTNLSHTTRRLLQSIATPTNTDIQHNIETVDV